MVPGCLTAQVVPLLPASLATLRLESTVLDLGALARANDRLIAALQSVLSVCANVVCCSLEVLNPRPEPHEANDVGSIRYAERLASKQPAGFSGLELHTERIAIFCKTAVEMPSKAAAAWELCVFFANAPRSYRRFSLCWPKSRQAIGLCNLELDASMLRRQKAIVFNSMEALATNCKAVRVYTV